MQICSVSEKAEGRYFSNIGHNLAGTISAIYLKTFSFLTWKIFIIFQVVVVGRFHSIIPSLPVRHLEIRGRGGAPILKGKEYSPENLN